MNRTELAARVAEMCGMDRKNAEQAVMAVFSTMAQSLQSGEKVQIMGFGVFEVKERAARIGRNPATKEEVEIPARRAVAFKPSKLLKLR